MDELEGERGGALEATAGRETQMTSPSDRPQSLDVNESLRAFIPLKAHFAFEVVPYFWNLNSMSFSPDHVELQGWALPHAGESENTRILVNGEERGEIRFVESAEVA